MDCGLLRELVSHVGVSGYEDGIRTFLKAVFGEVFDEVKVDPVGNLIGRKTGRRPGPKLLLSAHMDEVGLMVSKVEESGWIRFVPVGFLDAKVLPALHVNVHVRKTGNIMPGVIEVKHLLLQKGDDKDKAAKVEELYIDIGAGSRANVEDVGVRPGDFVSFARRYTELRNGRVCSNALDNRLGVLVMIEVSRRLRDFAGEIWGVATAMEEVGLRGARVSAFGAAPDVAIILDVAFATDVPSVSPSSASNIALGAGPCVLVMDRGTIADPQLVSLAQRLGEEMGVQIQQAANSEGRTDAGEINLAREGVPCLPILVPIRYGHSPIEVADPRDVDSSVCLAEKVVGAMLS